MRSASAAFDKQTIADFLGQETTGMAGYYSRDADLSGQMRKVVEFIDQDYIDQGNEPSSKVSNQRDRYSV
jgi:hypothetical protein